MDSREQGTTSVQCGVRNERLLNKVSSLSLSETCRELAVGENPFLKLAEHKRVAFGSPNFLGASNA